MSIVVLLFAPERSISNALAESTLSWVLATPSPPKPVIITANTKFATLSTTCIADPKREALTLKYTPKTISCTTALPPKASQ